MARILPPADNARINQQAQPLLGVERDELTALVMKLKRADSRLRMPQTQAATPSVAAIAWAEDWQLPREVHEYFKLDVAS